jgi:hypothetical protein
MSYLELIKTALKGGITLTQEGLESSINQNRRVSRRGSKRRGSAGGTTLCRALDEGLRTGLLVRRSGGYQLNPSSYEDFVWVHFESTQTEHPDWDQERVLQHLAGRWSHDGEAEADGDGVAEADESKDNEGGATRSTPPPTSTTPEASLSEGYERKLAVQQSKMEGMEIRHRRRVKNLQMIIQDLQAETPGGISDSSDEPVSPSLVSQPEDDASQMMVRLVTVLFLIVSLSYIVIPLGMVVRHLASEADFSLR